MVQEGIPWRSNGSDSPLSLLRAWPKKKKYRKNRYSWEQNLSGFKVKDGVRLVRMLTQLRVTGERPGVGVEAYSEKS